MENLTTQLAKATSDKQLAIALGIIAGLDKTSFDSIDTLIFAVNEKGIIDTNLVKDIYLKIKTTRENLGRLNDLGYYLTPIDTQLGDIVKVMSEEADFIGRIARAVIADFGV
jgi:hypothetical protein